MQAVTTIGFDIAKSVFQVHGIDAAGHALLDGETPLEIFRPLRSLASLQKPAASTGIVSW
jgi:hypothetical protein